MVQCHTVPVNRLEGKDLWPLAIGAEKQLKKQIFSVKIL